MVLGWHAERLNFVSRFKPTELEGGGVQIFSLNDGLETYYELIWNTHRPATH